MLFNLISALITLVIKVSFFFEKMGARFDRLIRKPSFSHV